MAKKAKKKSKRVKKPRKDYLSVSEAQALLDRWAAETNLYELVRRALTGEGPTDAHRLQRAIKRMESGAKFSKGSHGIQPTAERVKCREGIASLRKHHPAWTWKAVTAEVAKQLGIPVKWVRYDKTTRW